MAEIQTNRLIYYTLGVIESLLGFRLLLQLLAANQGSGFVALIYAITNIFVLPFRGIFPVPVAGASVFDPGILVAMIVYALLAKGLVEFIRIMKAR